MPKSNDISKEIIKDFEIVGETNEPARVLRTYSRLQSLTERINGDMAKNNYHEHELTLYCRVVTGPVRAG